jgi:hypothetical protein
MEKSKDNIYKKIINIMKDTGVISKKGRNDFHHYDYVMEADIIETLRDKLIEQGLVIIPNVVEVTHEGTLTTVKIQYTIIDSDSDDKLAIYCYGQGEDKGDKGVYKAITGAYKYMLLKTFMIPTGDDPEKSESEPVTNTQTEARNNKVMRSNDVITNAEALANGKVCKQCGSSRIIAGITKPDNPRNPNRPYWKCLDCPPEKSFSHWMTVNGRETAQKATKLGQAEDMPYATNE